MTFKVPEKYRVRTGRLGTTPEYGCNGLFILPHPNPISKLKFAVIASDGELWHRVEGYEGLYEVSSLGRVRSLPRAVAMPNAATRQHELHIVAQEVMESGYRRVSLCRDGQIDKRLVHVLVARTFINTTAGEQVNHRDGNKANNCVDNLELCSAEYNAHRAIENGLRTGLTVDQILEIKHLLSEGMRPGEIAEQMRMARQSVSDIKAGRHRNLNPSEPIRWTGPPHWEHVSVSLPSRCPTWDEMCWIKEQFWGDEDLVVQYHPPRSQYVSNHSFCLHLWRPVGAAVPAPPAWMVGDADLGTLR